MKFPPCGGWRAFLTLVLESAKISIDGHRRRLGARYTPFLLPCGGAVAHSSHYSLLRHSERLNWIPLIGRRRCCECWPESLLFFRLRLRYEEKETKIPILSLVIASGMVDTIPTNTLAPDQAAAQPIGQCKMNAHRGDGVERKELFDWHWTLRSLRSCLFVIVCCLKIKRTTVCAETVTSVGHIDDASLSFQYSHSHSHIHFIMWYNMSCFSPAFGFLSIISRKQRWSPPNETNKRKTSERVLCFGAQWPNHISFVATFCFFGIPLVCYSFLFIYNEIKSVIRNACHKYIEFLFSHFVSLALDFVTCISRRSLASFVILHFQRGVNFNSQIRWHSMHRNFTAEDLYFGCFLACYYYARSLMRSFRMRTRSGSEWIRSAGGLCVGIAGRLLTKWLRCECKNVHSIVIDIVWEYHISNLPAFNQICLIS